jgi:hypothetical protein
VGLAEHLREAREKGRRQLAEDLKSGSWESRFGHLRKQAEMDVGLRLVTAEVG